MTICKIVDGKIQKLMDTTFKNEKIRERQGLQEYLITSIDVIDENLLVIGNEFSEWEDSKRSIDILCIDIDANLVVIELKTTEDGGHMELQSLRYAAMISNMTFSKAVSTYKKFLERKGINDIDPQESILNFLKWNEPLEKEFGQDVKIILISSGFSTEITTSVLWLIEKEIDIRCIQMTPQKDGSDVFFEIKQIIPLPESSDYQIKFKEKISEERQSRRETSKRNYDRATITINGEKKEKLNKREAIYYVISSAINAKVNFQELFEITSKKWFFIDKISTQKSDFIREATIKNDRFDSTRWFLEDNERFHNDNKTYVFSNQQSFEAFDLISKIFMKFPNLNGNIEIIQSS